MFYFILFFVFCTVFYSVYSEFDLYAVASGFRWLLPVISLFFISDVDNEKFTAQVSRLLFLLLVLNFALQVAQLFFAVGWYGKNAWGLNARNPGFFLIPNTSAFYVCSSFFYLMFIGLFSNKFKMVILLVAGISVLLTLSMTGVACFIFISIFYFYKPKVQNNILALFSLGGAFYFIPGLFSSRGEGYLNQSGGTRIDIFLDKLMESNFLTDKFGTGTNTYVLLSEHAEILDSTYASLLVNLGLGGLIAVAILILVSLLHCTINKKWSMLIFIVFYSAYCGVTNLTEVYPVNLIFCITLIHFYNKTSRQKKGEIFLGNNSVI